MGAKYASKSATGYNSSPPADDGSQTAANLVKWSTIKTKLADPGKTLADDINTALVAAFDYSVRSITSSDNTVAGDHMRMVEIASTVTTAVTVSLGDAATMTTAYRTYIKNSSAISQTVGRVTVGDTIDGVAANVTLAAGTGALFEVNAAGNGYTSIGLKVSSSSALASSTTTVNVSAATAPTAGQVLTATGASTATWQTAVDVLTAQQSLISYVHADLNTAHRDTIKAGFIPAWFNQQWGGGVNGYELVDAATGTPYKFESATGYVEPQGDYGTIGNAAAATYRSMGFKVSSTQSIPAVWLRLFKTGNPTNNLGVFIYSDTAGAPNALIANGTATAISGKAFESGDVNGAMVRFTFATPPALTAGTQYHIVCKSSGAVDASNYWNWVRGTANKYPFGYNNVGDATPTWTPSTTFGNCFLVEAPTTTQTFQSGGIFGDGKAVFYEGSPLNQSNQRRADLADLKGLTPNNMTLLLRGTAHTKDKTIADMTYGLDHDRVVVRCAVTTGFPVLTVYDSAGTARTVTGTTDISSGDHDVAVLVTTAGCSLWVDGASQGTPIVATITFDTLFAQGQIGSLWIGGGFALAPTWSGSSISSFTGLPSTLGWTYAGVATEANAFSVSGSKLYQNKSGYTALQDGYYNKTTAGLSNANGYNIAMKLRNVSCTNTSQQASSCIDIYDGAKRSVINTSEYFIQPFSAAYFSTYLQADLKTADIVSHLIFKGSDGYQFLNGKLIGDYTGLITGATATNELHIGDISTTSGENADVVHSYWKYYTTAALLPQATAGSLSEWAIWTGDKTSILATLWNSGSPISVKQFCGLGVNWKRGDDGAWVHRAMQRGITSAPSLSTSTVLTKEMEAFVIGDTVEIGCNDSQLNNTVGAGHWNYAYLDGALMTPYSFSLAQIAGYSLNITTPKLPFKSYFGMHKAEGRAVIGSGVGSSRDTSRSFIAEGRN